MQFTYANVAGVFGVLLLLIVVYALLHPMSVQYSLAAFIAGAGPVPKYDLLFSIDLNEVPYTDSNSKGIVVRVKNHRPEVIFTGSWGQPSSTDIPSLYLCQASSGNLEEIALQLANKPSPETNSVIDVPGLAYLTVDDSSVAPDGYSLSGLRFDKAYGILDIVMPSPFSPFPSGKQLKEDFYKTCLRQVAGHQFGLTVHFIGWVIPELSAPDAHQ